LDKTRQKIAPAKSGKSWLEVFDILGRAFYFVGVLGQLLWNFAGASVYLLWRSSNILNFDLLHSEPLIDPDSDIVLSSLGSWIQAALDILYNDGTSTWSPKYSGIDACSLARGALLFTFLSFWWNPKFKEGYRGYHRHIKGFQDWYKYQALLLVARVVFWFVMKYELLHGVGPSATFGVHIFMLGFTLLVSTPKPQNCLAIY
jgi:hypothetical protein